MLVKRPQIICEDKGKVRTGFSHSFHHYSKKKEFLPNHQLQKKKNNSEKENYVNGNQKRPLSSVKIYSIGKSQVSLKSRGNSLNCQHEYLSEGLHSSSSGYFLVSKQSGIKVRWQRRSSNFTSYAGRNQLLAFFARPEKEMKFSQNKLKLRRQLMIGPSLNNRKNQLALSSKNETRSLHSYRDESVLSQIQKVETNFQNSSSSSGRSFLGKKLEQSQVLDCFKRSAIQNSSTPIFDSIPAITTLESRHNAGEDSSHIPNKPQLHIKELSLFISDLGCSIESLQPLTKTRMFAL